MAISMRHLVDRLFSRRVATAPGSRKSEVARGLEPLEERLLMAAGPRILGVEADNRGQVILKVDRSLNPATVTSSSVQLRVLSGGRYRAVPTAVKYLAKKGQIIATAALKADTPYQIYLPAKLLRGADGARLDGEFNGAGKASGDGRAGGDWVALTQTAAQPIARFSTTLGNIDVRLFATQTPLTVRNFLRYANASGDEAKYSWDRTFFHRSVPGLIQGGGYKVDSSNKLGIVWQRPAVPNEAFPNNPGNVRGTLGMYKVGAIANSATNQWYFNVGDNRATLDVEQGGYTVFGKIANAAGLKVMDKIAALKTYNIEPTKRNTPFSQTPVIDGDAVIARGKLNPSRDLVVVQRVAIRMDVVSATAAK